MFRRPLFRPLAVVALALLLGGCFTAFKPIDSGFRAKGRSIAVIPGATDNGTFAVAQMIGESLQKQSRFQVMPQKQIGKTLGVYPQNIKGPYRSAYFDIDVDWQMVDRTRIAGIQKALGVDYVYVVWVPTSVNTNNSKTSQLQVIAQLFESPAAKEVGRGVFPLGWREKDPTVLQKGVDKVALQVAERTGMQRDVAVSAK